MEKTNIGFKAGIILEKLGETVCCISGKSDTTYQKDKR